MIENYRFVSKALPWTAVLALMLIAAAPPAIILLTSLAFFWF